MEERFLDRGEIARSIKDKSRIKVLLEYLKQKKFLGHAANSSRNDSRISKSAVIQSAEKSNSTTLNVIDNNFGLLQQSNSKSQR